MNPATKAGLASLLLSAGSAWSAPITFNTALPVHAGGYVLREQFVFAKSADDPSPARRDMEVRGLVNVLGYGVSRDLALFAMLPYADKRLDMQADGQRLVRRGAGLGDLTLLGRYTACERNAPGRTFRLAPFVGVEAPTGESRAGDRRGRLPPPLQPGSGAWGALGGVVATYQTLGFQIDGQLSYKANHEGNGFRAGDVAGLDLSVQYRLLPRSLGAGVPAFLYGVLEARIEHAARDRVGGISDRSSGGTTLSVTPGLQYVTRDWMVEAGVQIPVRQDLNGSALKNDYVVTAGVRFNF